MSFKVFHISLILIIFSLSAFADENDDGYFLPSFRSGHNLSLFLSGEYTTWSANQTIVPSTQDPSQPVIVDAAHESKAVMALLFRYSYHINIISSFGFFVGSTVGIFASNGNYGKEKNFYPGYGIAFPSVLGGLVQGLGQNFRLLAGIEYGAVWFPQMKIYAHSTDSNNLSAAKDLSPAPDMYSFFVGIDNFLTRNTALSFNVGYRQINNPCLNSCSSSIYLNSLSITSKSYFAQLGVTWLVGSSLIAP